MILRDVIVAQDVRRLLRELPASTKETLASNVATVLETHDLVASIAPNSESASDVSESASAAFSLDAVMQWLVVQDEHTRGACAALLAEELSQVRSAAREEGFAAGQAEARAAHAESTSQLAALLESFEREAKRSIDQEAHSLANLSVEVITEVFTKLAGETLGTREAAIAVVSQVLARVTDQRQVTIRVSPAQHAVLQAAESTLTRALNGAHFELVADARVELGGCIVESALGTLDGRLELQLREVFAMLEAAQVTASEHR
jgi:flagellar biosynthesis/type III secretory pathway protein FliH